MDPPEDVSARVLLKHILSTEPPRTPITRRSASNTQTTSATRRSSRLSRKDAGAQTPQDILRRSLRSKLRESITRQSLPATKRRTASVHRKTPAPTSMLFDDGDTPRNMLMNILRTEPVKSPVVHETAASEDPQPSSAASSVTRKRSSIELSGLDLPDITIGNAASTAKGLSRKRPRRSLNVTAFEKRLKDGEDVEDQYEESEGEPSSLSLTSSTSLSLKTPFVGVQTEKKGLQRRVSNRRKITEEQFGAAVNRRQMGGVSSFVQVERGLSETNYSEGFTLSLSKLSEADLTTDILHCNTALYAQPDAMTSGLSVAGTHDKPTVMASQLQRQLEQEGQSRLSKDKSLYAFPTEEEAELQDKEGSFQAEEKANAAESQEEQGKSTDDDEVQEEEDVADSQTSGDDRAESEEENRVAAETGAADFQPEGEQNAEDPHAEEDVANQSEEEERAADSQTGEEQVESVLEEDDATQSESQEEEEEAAADSQTGEESADDSKTEEEQVESQHEEDDAAGSQSDEEEIAPDTGTKGEDAVYSETEEGGAVDLCLSEEEAKDDHSDQEAPATNFQSEDDGGLADSQPEEEHDGKAEEEEEEEEEDDEGTSGQLADDMEHISRRTHRSEGASGGKAHSSLESGNQEETSADADKENSFIPPEAGQDFDQSPEEAAEQEEESVEDDDEESDEIPSKTPAFIKQKINFLQTDHLASPSVFKNNQASSSGEVLLAPKQKPVRQRRKGPATKETGLPKSYLMGVFKHFAKTKVSADVYPVLKEIMEKYFNRLAEDLETYAAHAKRKTIEVEDVELLLKRQGYVNDKVPVEVLIEKYLRLDQRKLLIPIATSGNVVIPKMRR